MRVPGFNAISDPWGFSIRFMNTRGKPGQKRVDPANHYVLGDMGYCGLQPNGEWSFSLRVLPNDDDFLTADEPSEKHMRELHEYCERNCTVFADNLCDKEAYRNYYTCKSYGRSCEVFPVESSRLGWPHWGRCTRRDARHR